MTSFVIRGSVTLFYLRIFGPRKIVVGTMVGLVLFFIAFLIPDVVPCHPVSFYWDGWDGEHIGYCDYSYLRIQIASCFTTALDLWLTLLPVPILIRLNLDTRKKLAALGMFAFGLVYVLHPQLGFGEIMADSHSVVGVSAARIPSMAGFRDESKFTTEYGAISMWSYLEMDVGIICACLPSLRLLAVRLWPSRKSQSSDRKGNLSISSHDTPLVTIGSRPTRPTNFNGKMGLADITLASTANVDEEAQSVS